MTMTISGTIRGCGRQKIGACINLAAYYLMGIPTAILLAFFCHIGGKVPIFTVFLAYHLLTFRVFQRNMLLIVYNVEIKIWPAGALDWNHSGIICSSTVSFSHHHTH